jgi:hypothetical protein
MRKAPQKGAFFFNKAYFLLYLKITLEDFMKHIYGTLYNPVRVYCAACGTDDYFTFYRDRYASKDEKDDDLLYYEYGSSYVRKFRERVEKAFRVWKHSKDKKFYADDICMNLSQLQEFYTFLVEEQLKDFLTAELLEKIEKFTDFKPEIIEDDGWYDGVLFKSKSGFLFNYMFYDEMLTRELDDIQTEFTFGWYIIELMDKYFKDEYHPKKFLRKFRFYMDYVFKKRAYLFEEDSDYLKKDEVVDFLCVLSYIIKNQKTFHTTLATLCKK